MKYKTVPFHTNIEGVYLPFITVGIDNRRNVIMLIDTGSEYNQIFEYLYNEVSELFTKTDEVINLQGIGGEVTAPLMEGNIYVDNKGYQSKFLISSSETGKALSDSAGFPVGGLIGTRFLFKYGWIIDYGKQAVLIPKL